MLPTCCQNQIPSQQESFQKVYHLYCWLFMDSGWVSWSNVVWSDRTRVVCLVVGLFCVVCLFLFGVVFRPYSLRIFLYCLFVNRPITISQVISQVPYCIIVWLHFANQFLLKIMMMMMTMIGCEDRLRNDLHFVDWGVKTLLQLQLHISVHRVINS